jgi:hypothetical protein
MNLRRWRVALGNVLAVAALGALLPTAAFGQASCNGLLTVSYVSGINFAVPGDIIRVRMQIGSGQIMPSGSIQLTALRFDLDCNDNFPLVLGCTDEGSFVEYEGDGTITSNCGVVWSTGHAVSASPNQVVFTPSPSPIVIPANQATPPGFCEIQFDVKVLQSPSIDSTPNAIQEVGGYKTTDATCSNNALISGGTQSSAIPLCPTCTGTECTMSACNQMTGQCDVTPKPDSTPCTDTDQNACTTAGCNAVGSCDQAHLTLVCDPDNNECTNDLACDPLTGQCPHPPKPDSTPCTDSDNNACTTPGCEAGQCVQAHLTTPCPPDNNECTNDLACDPTTGQCPHPPKPDSTPCTDSDGNLCTTAGCEAGQCVQTHQTTPCPPDNNECTLDPACNPATGQCTHPPAPDSTPCTDTDQNACTVAGCEAGQCVQPHVEVCQTPDHFQCYEIKPRAFSTLSGISVEDQFGLHSEKVRFPHRLCAPANKNGEDPTAPSHPDHLQGHRVSGPNVRVANLDVTNQFGTIKLDITKPDVLMEPTLKTLALPGPAAPPTDPNVPDHFQCYKAKRSKGSPKFQKILGVQVQDQFGTATLDLLKPIRLCAPANKQNEDPSAPQHLFHLLCYKTKNSAFGMVQTYTNDQFGPAQPLLIHRRELCVPSTKNGALPSTTTTSTPPTTTTSSTGPVTTTTTSTTTSTTVYGMPSAAFLDEPVDLLD